MMTLSDIETGKYVYGDTLIPWVPPNDFDLKRFHNGRMLFVKNILSCSCVMLFSLILGMSLPGLLAALVYTKQSNTPSKALKRYLQTFRHVALWHYGNVWDTDSEACKSLQFVRKLHHKVRHRVQEEFYDDSSYFLSQYDMAVVQSGFMGLIVMYHRHFGIACSQQDIDDYIYFWYGIGHLLGVDGQYNICAHGTKQALSFCKEIELMVVGHLKNPAPDFHLMSKATIEGFANGRKHLTLLSFAVIKHLVFEAASRNTESLHNIDRIRYCIWKFIFLCSEYLPGFNLCVGFLIQKLFRLSFTD